MRTLLTLLALGAGTTLASAKIVPTFENVEGFTDFTLSGQSEERTQSVFERELARNSMLERVVGDRTLEITFTDIDMAGDIQPWRNRHNSDIRYVEAIYPPRMAFRYVLRDADGKELASGEERLIDMSFQHTASPIGMSDPFRYELQQLTDWARRTLREVK